MVLVEAVFFEGERGTVGTVAPITDRPGSVTMPSPRPFTDETVNV
jgi:hypothetical protein